jgi:hypothetical protein
MAPKKLKLNEFAEQLRDLTNEMVKEEVAQLSGRRALKVRKTITDAYEKLKTVMDNLDPYKDPGFVFDPSNPNIAGRVAGIALIVRPRKPLVYVESFYGSGIYAIYYTGDFLPYRAISKKEHPIYVGKADPKNLQSKTAVEQGAQLTGRLKDHRRTIGKAKETLRLEDFEYRALVVQTGWQEAAESYLIDLFKPIWNNEVGICYGFGKHGDDPGTRANLRSPWDTLHHGRDWAHRDPNMMDARPKAQIVKDIARHFAEHPPLASVDKILRRFLEEMRGSA